MPGTRPVPELFYPDPPGPVHSSTRSAQYPEKHYPDPPGTRVFGTRPITSLVHTHTKFTIVYNVQWCQKKAEKLQGRAYLVQDVFYLLDISWASVKDSSSEIL